MDKNHRTVQEIAKVLLVFAGAWLLVNTAVGIWTGIATLAAVVTGAFGAAVAILTSPILLVIIAIGALGLAIYLLIDHWDELKATAEITWELIKAVWKVAAEWFDTNVTTPLSDLFNISWVLIKTLAGQAWDTIKTTWKDATTWFKENVTQPLEGAFDDALFWIEDSFSTVFTGIKEFVKGVINGIIALLNGMISAIISSINSVINAINSIHINIPGVPYTGFGGYNFGGVGLPILYAPQIPLLATGAVIPPNAAFAAILGDQRSGRNIESPEALLRQIVREEVGQRQDNVNITFGGTMGELVRLLKPQIDRETVRVGGSLIQTGVTS
jgi:hypothetical protein